MLLFDGVFLLRPELIDQWDLSIFLSVTFDRTLERAQARATALAGFAAGPTDIERSRQERYIPTQKLYFAQVRPADHADIIVNCDELQQPGWEIRAHRSAHRI